MTAGTTATLSLVVTYGGITDAGSGSCVPYPCLGIAADNAGVSFSGGSPLLYCLTTGWTYTMGQRRCTFVLALPEGSLDRRRDCGAALVRFRLWR